MTTKLLIASSQESLSNQLIDELRAVIHQPKYDYIHLSTSLGVLFMLILEMHERARK